MTTLKDIDDALMNEREFRGVEIPDGLTRAAIIKRRFEIMI